MFSFARLLLFPLLFIMLILCSAVPALGKRATVDDPAWHAFGFDACALPCWAGITPGQTSFDKAFALLVQHVPTLNTQVLMSGSQIPFSASLPDQYASGFIYYSQGEVGNIRLSVQLPFVQLIERLGTPSCFFYAEGPYGTLGSLTVYWELDGVLIAGLVPPGNADVQPTTSIDAVAFNPDEPACFQEDTLPWLGFAPRWRYEQADQRHG
jgi:hypothetical protein